MKYNHVVVSGDSLNEITWKSCDVVNRLGSRVDSRVSPSKEICGVEVILNNPRNRHLSLLGRTNDIYATFAEIFWVFSGTDLLDPFLNFWLKRAPDYSDDGLRWHDAYGPRIYEHNQIENIVDVFLKDGIYTRRAVAAIYQPDKDSQKALLSAGNLSQKAIPCNNILWFWIRDNKLNLKVGVRSNDLIFGFSNINIPEWTFLQEMVLSFLKNSGDDRFKNLQLGHYHHSVVSLHVYDSTSKQMTDILGNSLNKQRFVALETNPIEMSGSYTVYRAFFKDLYDLYCQAITGDSDTANLNVARLFSLYAIPTTKNALFDYALLVEMSIKHKKGVKFDAVPYLRLLPADLRAAVVSNKFTPDEWKKI